MDNSTRFDKYDRAILALIQYKSFKKAAAALRIHVTTLWRWFKDPEFQRRYRLALAQFETEAMATLREAESLAATTLVSVLKDPRSNPVLRVQVAEKILRHCVNRPAFAQLNLEDLPPDEEAPVVVIPVLPCGGQQLDSGSPRESNQPSPEAQVVPVETALQNAAGGRPQTGALPKPISDPEAQVPELKSAAPSVVGVTATPRLDGLLGGAPHASNQPSPDAKVVPLAITPQKTSDGHQQAGAPPKTTGSPEAQAPEPKSAVPSPVAGAKPARAGEQLGSGSPRESDQPSPEAKVVPLATAPEQASDVRPQAGAPPKPIGSPAALAPEPKSVGQSVVGATASPRADALLGDDPRASIQPSRETQPVPPTTAPPKDSEFFRALGEKTGNKDLIALADKIALTEKVCEEAQQLLDRRRLGGPSETNARVDRPAARNEEIRVGTLSSNKSGGNQLGEDRIPLRTTHLDG